MHASAQDTAQEQSVHAEKLSKLSRKEKLDNKQRNEAQLGRETDWDELQEQVTGTLSFLDSERCVAYSSSYLFKQAVLLRCACSFDLPGPHLDC